MSLFYSPSLAKFIKKLPGKKFGNYRFLPVFFLLGAGLEFTMINWQVGQTNFYRTYKKSQARKIAESRLHETETST